jgi:peptidoglycan/LPS O-acetylase OafA/YrhL
MARSPLDAELEEKGLGEGHLPEPRATTKLAKTMVMFTDFLRHSLWHDAHRPARQTPLRSTAYLDGLRGFAAFLVYVVHHQGWGHSNVEGSESILGDAFGWNGQYYFVGFPGIRLLFTGGHVGVAIFFVTSGYVLSHKSLSLIHAGEHLQLADSLASAMFRRWLRLYLPIIATTFIWITLWHVFGIRHTDNLSDPPESNFRDEIWKWYCDFKNFSFIFENEPWNKYNSALWTIPKEFRGSIVVWTALLAFGRFSRNARLCCETGLAFYFLYIVDGWYCAAFVIGLLLCDLDLLSQRNSLPSLFYRLERWRRRIFWILFLVGVYLGGVPSSSNDIEHLKKSPGWHYLSFLKPQAVFDFRTFYRLVGGVFIMAAIPRLPWLKRFFELSFCQYLGRISYSLYLVHGPIHWAIGDRLYAAVGRVRVAHMDMTPAWINRFALPDYGPFGLEVNFLIPHLVLVPMTFWIAEICTKLFDEPSTKAAQYLYNALLDKSGVSEKR